MNRVTGKVVTAPSRVPLLLMTMSLLVVGVGGLLAAASVPTVISDASYFILLFATALSVTGLGKTRSCKASTPGWLAAFTLLTIPAAITYAMATHDLIGTVRSWIAVPVLVGVQLRQQFESTSMRRRLALTKVCYLTLIMSCSLGVAQTLANLNVARAGLGTTAAITTWGGWYRANGFSRTSQDLALLAGLGVFGTWGVTQGRLIRVVRWTALVALAATLTRGAWAAAAVAATATWLARGGNLGNRLRTVSVLVVLGVAGSRVDAISSRLQQSGQNTDVSFFTRLYERWPRVISQAPIFTPLHALPGSLDNALTSAVGGTIDNSYLFAAAIGGWVAGLGLAAAMAVAILHAHRLAPTSFAIAIFIALYAVFVDFQNFSGLTMLAGVALGFTLSPPNRAR